MLPKEYSWFLTHPESENQYAGEYIAIVGEQIVAHGKDFAAVLQEAEQHGQSPFIHKVPAADKDVVV